MESGEGPKCFFISGITRSLSAKDIEDYFSAYGSGARLRLRQDRNGRSLGYGWISFSDVDVERLVNEQHKIADSPLVVRMQSSRDSARPNADSNPLDLSTSASKTPQMDRPSSPQAAINRRRHREESTEVPSHNSSRKAEHRHESVPGRQSAPPVTHTCESPYQVNNSLPAAATHDVQLREHLPTVPGTNAPPVYACIPLSICPPAFLHDPRVFCCICDPSEVGKLSIIVTPSVRSANTGFEVISAAQTAGNHYPIGDSRSVSAPRNLVYTVPSESSPLPPSGPPPCRVPLPSRSSGYTGEVAPLPPPPPPPGPPPPPPGPPPNFKVGNSSHFANPPPPGPPPKRN